VPRERRLSDGCVAQIFSTRFGDGRARLCPAKAAETAQYAEVSIDWRSGLRILSSWS
jgi:hypothetical protein